MPNSMLDTVRQKLRQIIGAHHLLDGVSSLLVAFSGGADSTLLLALLSEFEHLTVAAAHLNHSIRGEEADRDEAFCRDFCRQRDITLYVSQADVPSLAAQSGRGIEETARDVRYAYLQSLKETHGFDAIATAHHADDNLETVLMHLSRGTGLDGLCGIPPRRGHIIRPLLLCRKEEIEAACREAVLPHVTDSTNADTVYTRNYIRAEILPRLAMLNPALTENVSTTSRLLRRDAEYLQRTAAPHSLADGRHALATLDRTILSRVLLSALRERGLTPDADHIEDAMDMIASEKVHASLSLPGGRLICDRDCVTVSTEPHPTPCPYVIPLIPGENQLPNGDLLYLGTEDDIAAKDINRLKNIYKLSIQATLDSATIEKGVCARLRLPGDTYRLRGMTRSVKKLLQETKAPLTERDTLPFLVRGHEILWIPGFPPADAAHSDGCHPITVLYCRTTRKETD